MGSLVIIKKTCLMPPKTIRNGKKSFQAIKKENIAKKEDANKTDKIKNMI